MESTSEPSSHSRGAGGTEIPDWASPLPPDEPVRLILMPRYSLAWIMVFTAVVAGLLVVVRHAIQGAHWALAVVAAIGSALIAFALFSGVYVLALLVVFITRAGRHKRPVSPFATDRLPPQIVPPRGPE